MLFSSPATTILYEWASLFRHMVALCISRILEVGGNCFTVFLIGLQIDNILHSATRFPKHKTLPAAVIIDIRGIEGLGIWYQRFISKSKAHENLPVVQRKNQAGLFTSWSWFSSIPYLFLQYPSDRNREFHFLHTLRNCTVLARGNHSKILSITSSGSPLHGLCASNCSKSPEISCFSLLGLDSKSSVCISRNNKFIQKEFTIWKRSGGLKN